MTTLAVDKIKKKVTLFLADKSQISGQIFLSPYSELGVGRQSLFEVLTTQDRFIPFQSSEGEFSFLNLRQIVWVTCLRDPDTEEEPPVPLESRNVVVFLRDGKLFRGDMEMSMPEGKTRLSDWLNEFNGFMIIRDDTREILINLDFVIRVI